MPLTARPRSPRLLVLAAVTAALVPVLVAGPAAAEDPAVPEEVAAGDTVVGELVRAFADPEHAGPDSAHAAGHPGDALLSFVDTPGEGAVRVPTEDVASLEAGATVEVTVGAEVRDEASVEQGLAPAREVVEAEVVAPADAAATTAPHTNAVTVVLVQPAGEPRDGTVLADVVAAVDGPVRDYWHEQSDGAVSVAVTAAHDWISTAAGCADPLALWEEVAAHPDVAWAGAPGTHLLLYVPAGTPDCSYGLGTIGSGIGDGGLAYVQDTATSVIAHELGHNFGLGHSSAVQCDASPESAPCRTVEYWDFYDVMGISWDQVGSLNAPHAARLGLLPSSASRSVSASGTGGTHTLTPMGSRSGVRALSLTTGSTRYWVEYRAAVGQDSWLSDPWTSYGLEPGVLVHLDGPGPLTDTSLLLDGTPSTEVYWDLDEQTVLPPGGRVTVGGFTVTVGPISSTGATVTVRTPAEGPGGDTAIGARYRQLGGPSGRLGAPLSAERCGLRGGGCLQEFEGGSIYWSPATGARLVDSEILDRWGVLGWEIGYFGYPVADARCGLRDGGCLQLFQGGSIYWTPFTGARAVDGAIRDRWGSLGWEFGRYGYPVTDARCGLRDGGCLQLFERGSVYWSPATGAQAVDGEIRDRWGSLGWEIGRYGYPVTGARCGLRGDGCVQLFQGGSIYWTPVVRAQAVDGAIRDRWGSLGWETGRYGYPAAGARCGLRGGGCLQLFERGFIYWSPATGAQAVDGEIFRRWGQTGYENGYLGYPVAGARCGLRDGGCLQQFQGGTVYWTLATYAFEVTGPIWDAWAARGYENGPLGYPTGAPGYRTYGGQARAQQSFQGGYISITGTTLSVVVTGR